MLCLFSPAPPPTPVRSPHISPRGFPAPQRRGQRRYNVVYSRDRPPSPTPLSLLRSRAEIFLSGLLRSLCCISELLFHPRLFLSLLTCAACSRCRGRPFYIPAVFEQEVSHSSRTGFAKFIIAYPLLGLRGSECSVLHSAMALSLSPEGKYVSFILGMPTAFPR